ncbi:MAG: KH domain-containing protein, partial [Verrucomicrobia bacterium]|nr:KH domain-containing protein [Verrucomicrobiota bacterium]
MQEFLEYVIKGLVDKPEAVDISPVERRGSTVYRLWLDPGDIAKVTGRQGTTINAVRTLLQMGGAKKGRRCTPEIVEDTPA